MRDSFRGRGEGRPRRKTGCVGRVSWWLRSGLEQFDDRAPETEYFGFEETEGKVGVVVSGWTDIPEGSRGMRSRSRDWELRRQMGEVTLLAVSWSFGPVYPKGRKRGTQ